jgi:hypothetical protein
MELINRAVGTRAGTGTLWGATAVAQKNIYKKLSLLLKTCSEYVEPFDDKLITP